MKTFILFWNPAISSYTLKRLQDDLNEDSYVRNWSIWEHDQADCGDRFFMVRCGDGNTGICMSGLFFSKPYIGEDWSGRGRQVYYVDLMADVVLHPDTCPILNTATLQRHIPDFDWTGGHSGRLLPEKDATRLEELWKKHIDGNQEMFRKISYRREIDSFFPSSSYKETDSDKLPAQITLTENGGYLLQDYYETIEMEGMDLQKLKEEFTAKMIEEEFYAPSVFEYKDIHHDDQQIYAVAESIARRAYAEMTDVWGRPYYAFAVELAGLFSGAKNMAALLSGVLRNTNYTRETLINEGIPSIIVDTVEKLILREDEDYEQYVSRMASSSDTADIASDAAYISINLYSHADISSKDMERLVAQTKAWHLLERPQRAVFNGECRNFRWWLELNEYVESISIEGKYTAEDIALMSKILEPYSFDKVDISRLEIDFDIEDHAGRNYDNETEMYALEKMILNRKYSTTFDKGLEYVLTLDGKVLVHIPTDEYFDLPDGIEVIGRGAVANNKQIKELIYPNGLRRIDEMAFINCENLTTVFLSDSVTALGKGCFYGCDIEDLRLPSTIKEIPDEAFAYNSIVGLNIPSSVRRIGVRAFFCNLHDERARIVIPEGVEIIESQSFRQYTGKIILPSTLKNISPTFYYEEGVDDSEDRPFIEVSPKNPVFYSKDGRLYRKDNGQRVV